MNIPRDVRRFFRYYRFEDFPPETQEAILQVREYEKAYLEGSEEGRSAPPSRLNDFNPYTPGGLSIMIPFRKRRQPTVAQIERIISKVADDYGYGNVWLFGNYYVGLYSEGCPVQVMLDSSENPRHPLGFAGACRRETGLDAVVYLSATDPELTEYVMKNSRLIHHA